MLGALYLGQTYVGGYLNTATIIALVNLFLSIEFEKAELRLNVA